MGAKKLYNKNTDIINKLEPKSSNGADELSIRLQTTQPTSGGAVTADTHCCANCVKTSRPPQWGPDLPFFVASRPFGPAGCFVLLLIKAGDVETNPGPTTSHKLVWIGDICYKQIHVRKQISIRWD